MVPDYRGTTVPCYPARSSPATPYNFAQVPPSVWVAVNMYLSSLNWYDLMDTPDVDDALARFSSSLNDAFSHYLSSYRKISSSTQRAVSRKYPPWVNRDLVLAIKLKYELYSRYRKFPTPANQSAFKVQRNRVRNLSRSLHRDYLASIQASMASGNLNMYQFVRSQRNRQQDRRYHFQLFVPTANFMKHLFRSSPQLRMLERLSPD